MFKAGFQFAPGFRIQKFLGRGQFGQVWQVVAPGGTVAAVKFIDLNAGEGQKEYEGVKRVKQIRQANLMPITAIWKLDEHGKAIDEVPDAAIETKDLATYDPSSQDTHLQRPDETISINQEASWLAVAMLLGGNSLDMQLRELAEEGKTGIPVDNLISYMQDAAKGLDFLNQRQHDLGHGPVAIQHCDVKPSNIVTIGNSAVICDFGLAKVLNRSQATTANAAGTPHYMAPEAIVGAPSLTSDQYSLAVTYYHLRTGELPATGESVWKVLDAHRKGQLNFDKVDLAERQVLRKATDIDWKKRFESCAEMVDALRDAMRGVSLVLPSVNPDDQETLDLQAADTSLDHSIHVASDTSNGSGDRSRIVMASVAGVGIVAAVLGLLVFGPSIGGSSTPRNVSQNQPFNATDSQAPSNNKSAMTTANMMTSALLALDQEEDSAINWFTRAIERDGGLSIPIVVTLANDEPIQKVMLGRSTDAAADQDDLLVAIGLSPPPMVYPLPKIASDGYSIELSSEQNRWIKGEGHLIPAALAIAPDGKELLLANGASLTVLPLSLSQTKQAAPLKLDGPAGEVLAVVWHPHDPIIVSAHDAGEIAVWELTGNSVTTARKNKRRQTFPTEWTATSMVISPDGQWLVALSEKGGIQVFDWADIKATLDVQQAPKSRSIKSPGTATRVIDFVSVTRQSGSERLSCVAAGGEDGEVTLWKLPASDQDHEPENLGRLNAHGHTVESLHVATWNEAPVIVSSGSDGTVGVWKPESPNTEPVKRRFGTEPIATTVVTADGRWIALGNEAGEIWLWDWVKNPDKPLLVFDSPSWIDDLIFDSKEEMLFAAGDDQTIRIWNFRQLKLLALVGTTIEIEVDETRAGDSPKVAHALRRSGRR